MRPGRFRGLSPAALAAAALLLAAPALLLAAPAGAQFEQVKEIHLDDVDAGAGGRRDVDLYLRALARTRDPVEGLRPVDLQVSQDGQRVELPKESIRQLSESGRGAACVLAIDTSRSMKGEPFDRARAAAVDFVDHLGPNDRVAVVSFAGKAEVVAPFSASRGEVRVAIESLQPDAAALSTVLYDGVHRAVELIRETRGLPRRSYVIVFSDGEDDGSTQTLQSVIDLANGAVNEPRVLLFAIGYARFGTAGMDALHRMASGTTAEFYQASELGQIPGYFSAVANQVAGSYLVSFPAQLDGKGHRVEVQAEGQRDQRAANYPYRAPPWWWYAGPAAVLLLVVGLGSWLWLRRSPGRLVFVSGYRVGDRIALRQGTLRIGAIDDNDIVVPSARISRYHAQLVVDGRRVEIEDLGSLNGTDVNDSRIQRCKLRPGDRIALAREVELEYQR